MTLTYHPEPEPEPTPAGVQQGWFVIADVDAGTALVAPIALVHDGQGGWTTDGQPLTFEPARIVDDTTEETTDP